ncbi:pyruvate, water dikinase regulatory protein [Bacillus sp. 165]|uniref:pyruvate, water dikinase regulatory protein n=1 Tax=Bacillus sp. 165 TaxID=1529117 RepID=UPI001ADB783A|nr:pyruvate, water dikinase regulatory protein [Bacillus sp. 165]MBO9129606.1 kinase/pyrophosphorylase [Bacillus sp. 165]
MSNQIVYVVSDSVGETADLVVRAAMGQFALNPDIRRVPYVEDTSILKEVISIAKSNHAIICYTLVKPNMRRYLVEEAEREGVVIFDIIGPLIDKIQSVTNATPRYEPGVVRKLDEDYFKKIEAIEFAVKYDDGRDPRGILKADIILIGVSRTSKTPLSQYLAHKRLKVANVPLVPEVDPPEELYLVPKEKCFGLKIVPEKLNNIRKERLKALGLSDGASYANIERIKEELTHFEKVVDKIGCQIIDVSDKAIEESANIILNAVQNYRSF